MSTIKEFKIIRGMPGSVEQEVDSLLKENVGWTLHGKMFAMTLDGHEIVVQGMARRALMPEERESVGFPFLKKESSLD